MKSTFRQWFIALLAAVFLLAAIGAIVPAVTASADDGNITCETAAGSYLNDDYINVYKIPVGMFTYENNGGESGGNTLSKAFDGMWNTSWYTGKENDGQNTDNPAFLNAITVTFTQPVTIESIAYASSDSRLGHGYPTRLNIYTANGGDLTLYGTCNSTATNDRVIFKFKETVTVTQVKFEFRIVNTMHNWTATAKEICFLQPDNASANKVLDLFDDYTQLTVKDEYKSQLSGLRSGVKDLISYESALKPLLDRAEKVVGGELKKDSKREFSTDPKAENVIQRWGNMRDYAGGTLKMTSFGINRQVTGVGGLTGDTITVYVDAPEGDPLPSLAFCQVHGDWTSWQSGYQLSRGKNVVSFPNFINGNYTAKVIPGGTVHIVNAYEPSQQSSDVKVYIEGGFLYPVFRKGGDVEKYRTELTAYKNEMQNNEGMCDVSEVVCDHAIQTFSATVGYQSYVTNKVNPQKSAEGWDRYLRALLEFDGVSFTPGDEYYNEKNFHLYTNFRVVQEWAGAWAFSAGDHIGLCYSGDQAALANYSDGLGWGFAHEIGHALDVGGRVKGETTNNMWSKFALAYFEHRVDRNMNGAMTQWLTPDETAVESNYFGTGENYYSYQLWWNLETVHHGFWGKLDNLYRYYNETAAREAAGVTEADGRLSQDERIVYYSSLAVGEDLGYLYERFGFSFSAGSGNYVPFRLNSTSEAYKKLIQKALDDKVIEYKGFKYWYIDADQYFLDGWTKGCFDPSTKVEILGAEKTSQGYVLYLQTPSNPQAKLGYEIMEYRGGNWSVIGFTNGKTFTDSTAYEDGYVPQYKIRGYDRALNVSAESTPKSYNDLRQTGVCRIGDAYYDSLSEAVAAAQADDTIYICADLLDATVTVDKNLTILPDGKVKNSVTVGKSRGGVLITVNGGVTLTVGANDCAKIIFDGNLISQSGALIFVGGNGKLTVNNAEFRNGVNTEHGGAVFVNGSGAVAEFNKVIFKNNSVTGWDRNGGAIADFGGNVTLTDCTLTGNSTNTNGGAITVDGKLTLIRCTITDNKANDKGGAMFIACNGNDKTVTVEGGEISGNTAKNGGSAIYHGRGVFIISGADSSLRISGEIYRGEAAMSIENAVPDFSGVVFLTSFVSEGTVLLKANGELTLDEGFVKGLNVENSDARLGEDGKSVLLTPWSAVTFIVNGKESRQQAKSGNYVLPYTVSVNGFDSEKRYVSEWEYDGKTYNAGDTVEIKGDSTLTAVGFGDKYRVTFRLDDRNVVVKYAVPNVNFVLDVTDAPEGKEIAEWIIGGKTYKPGATVKISDDTEILAEFKDAGKDKGPSNAWVIIVIIVVLVLVIAGAAVALVLILKRRKTEYDYEDDEEEDGDGSDEGNDDFYA